MLGDSHLARQGAERDLDAHDSHLPAFHPPERAPDQQPARVGCESKASCARRLAAVECGGETCELSELARFGIVHGVVGSSKRVGNPTDEVVRQYSIHTVAEEQGCASSREQAPC